MYYYALILSVFVFHSLSLEIFRSCVYRKDKKEKKYLSLIFFSFFFFTFGQMPQHVGSNSLTRDRSCTPCFGR